MNRHSLAALALAAVCITAPVWAQVRLVKDIEPPRALGSDPQFVLVNGSQTYFLATSVESGRELWVTDGTSGGTRQVADTNPGRRWGTFPSIRRQVGEDFVAVGGNVYWRLSAEYNYRFELWKTDGTVVGTALAVQLGAGCEDAPEPEDAPKYWAAARGEDLYLMPAVCGGQLWKYHDPTGAATKVADLPLRSIHNVNGRIVGLTSTAVYFEGDGGGGFTAPLAPFQSLSVPLPTADGLLFISTASSTRELWSTDGTPAGTVRRATFTTNLPTRILGVLGTKALLLYGGGLLSVDMTTGESISITMPTNVVHSSAIPDRLIFIVDGGDSRTLWSSDGTAAGTIQCRSLLAPFSWFFESFATIGGKTYFMGRDTEHGEELWVTDGTSDGTKLVTDILPGTLGSIPTMSAMGSQLLIAAKGATVGNELWSYDGTEAGIALVADIAADTGTGAPRHIMASGPRLFFQGYSLATGYATWTSDGTDEGTQLLVDQFGQLSETYLPLGSIGSKFYFNSGDGSTYNYHVFESDGTPAGTKILGAEIPALANFRVRRSIETSSGLVLFKTAGEYKVVSTDGTNGGTEVLPIVASIGSAALFRGRVATDHAARYLRSTDGTPEGTRSLAQVNPYRYQAVDETLFVFGWAEGYGNELWATDGTPEGSRLVADLTPGPGSSKISPMLPLAGKLAFVRDLDELWTSDGTAAGTYPVATIPPRPNDFMFSTGSRLLFYAKDESGMELWQSDGTAAGTSRLADICPGPESSGDLSSGAVIRGVLYFAASDCSSGLELWMSDGTPAGTRQVADIAAGPTSSSPQEFTEMGGEVYFTAYRPDVGLEFFAYRPERTASSTSLIVSATSIALGDFIDLTASVLPEGTETPVNGVEFVVDGDVIRSVPLVNGSATTRVESLAGGVHSVVARYVGDSLVSASQSAAQAVAVASRDATLLATISASEVVYGAPLIIDTQLQGTFASPFVPTGVVVVREGASIVAARSVVDAAASIALPNLPAGAHSLVVSYERDASFVTDTVELTVTVVPATTTIVLSGVPVSMEPGATVTIRAELTRPYPTPSIGVMRLLDGTQLLVEYPPGYTDFAYILGPLSEGPHEIVVEFGGDPNYEPATARKAVLVTNSPQVLTVLPAGVCKGQSFFNFAIDGQYFDSTTVVAINTQPLTTQFINSGRLLASNASALPAASSGQLSITRADGATRQLSLPFSWSYAAPSVTPPPALTVVATHTIDRVQAVSAETSPAFAAWLDGGSATDDCTYAAPERLPRTLSGIAIADTTPVFVGMSTIQFPYRDTAGNAASAGASVVVIPRGSLDGNVVVNATDMVILANYLVGNIRHGSAPFNSPLEAGDLNADGKVNSVDLVILANLLVGNITVVPAI